jgi:hypothetical protein
MELFVSSRPLKSVVSNALHFRRKLISSSTSEEHNLQNIWCAFTPVYLPFSISKDLPLLKI